MPSEDDPDDAQAPATEALVSSFERRIGSSLPADYRQYLLAVNGGSPGLSMYRGEVIEVYIQWIFSLLSDEEEGLAWQWQIAYLPETFKRVLLPIAKVNGGDLLYLSLVNGEVFFYSHEEDSFTRIEESFSAVLSNLHDEPNT